MISRRILFTLLLSTTVSASSLFAGEAPVPMQTQGVNLWAGAKKFFKDTYLAGWDHTKSFFRNSGYALQQDWRAFRGKNIETGGDIATDGPAEGFFDKAKRVALESTIPTVGATAAAIASLFAYEQILQTSSRRRNKALVLPLVPLFAAYGARLARREDITNEGSPRLGHRLAFVGIGSGALTFLISLLKQATTGSLNEVGKDEEEAQKVRRNKFSFGQHILWGAEVGGLYTLAIVLGYKMQQAATPSVGGHEE